MKGKQTNTQRPNAQAKPPKAKSGGMMKTKKGC